MKLSWFKLNISFFFKFKKKNVKYNLSVGRIVAPHKASYMLVK